MEDIRKTSAELRSKECVHAVHCAIAQQVQPRRVGQQWDDVIAGQCAELFEVEELFLLVPHADVRDDERVNHLADRLRAERADQDVLLACHSSTSVRNRP